MNKALFDINEITKAVKLLVMPGALFEIRAISKTNKPKTISGIFDSADQLQAALEAYTNANSWRRANPWEDRNVYITLNQLKPSFKGLAQYNRLIENPGKTAADADIIRRNWLLIDLDPKRDPAEISSSAEEKQQAAELAKLVLPYMQSLGFPEPVKADSGNGFHMLFRIDLENTEENKTLLESCLAALDASFSNDFVNVDTTVFNAARISKLYGTTAQKGSNTPERPHRMSRIISIPEEIQTTPREALEALAATLPQEPAPEPQPQQQPQTKNFTGAPNNPSWQKFDFDEFMRNPLLSHKTPFYWNNPKGANAHIYPLDVCPFCSDHTNGDAKIFAFDNGGFDFVCKHNSCKGNRWTELRQKLDPSYDPDAWKERRYMPTASEVFAPIEYEPLHLGADEAQPPAPVPPQTPEEYKKESCVLDYLAELRGEIAKYKDLPRTGTGFNYLDSILGGGVMEDNLYTLGGATGTGKTALCVQMARNIAMQGRDVLYFSLETHKRDIITRLVSLETWVLSNHDKEIAQAMLPIKQGRPVYPYDVANRTYTRVDEVLALINKAWEQVATYAKNLYVPALSIGGIDAQKIAGTIAAHYKATGNKPVVFIDYLQLCIFGDKSNRSDKQKVDEVVFQLKNIASGALAGVGCPAIPIFCISALNRENYTEEANLAAFKEAASIEYTSSIVAGAQYQGADYQEKHIVKTTDEGIKDYYVWESQNEHKARMRKLVRDMDEKAHKGDYQRIEFKILKNRNGYKDKVIFDYYPKYNYFSELPEADQRRIKQGALDWEDEIQKDTPLKVITEGKDLPGGYFGAIQKFLTDYYSAQALAGIDFLDPHNGKDIYGTVTATGEKFTISATTKNAKAPWIIATKLDKKKPMPWGLDAVHVAQSLHALPDVPEPPQQTTLEGMGEDVTTEEADEIF